MEALLSGPRPTKAKDADRLLYDRLVVPDSPLLAGVDAARLAKSRPKEVRYALPKERFGTRLDGKPVDGASLVAAADTVIEVRLPAGLSGGRAFVVEGQLDGARRSRRTVPGTDHRARARSPVG